jgi:hypothetical protein
MYVLQTVHCNYIEVLRTTYCASFLKGQSHEIAAEIRILSTVAPRLESGEMDSSGPESWNPGRQSSSSSSPSQVPSKGELVLLSKI